MKKNNVLKLSLISVALGMLLGVIVVLITGRDPFDMFSALIRTGTGFNLSKPGPINVRYIFEFLVYSMPIILTGLSVGFAYRTGLFNIGAEGQVMVGSLAAIYVAFFIDLPPVIHAIVAVIAAMIAGALWAFVPGIIKATKGINEVVICIMMNYTSLHFCNFFIKQVPGGDLARTPVVPDSVSLSTEFLKEMTNQSRFNWGFILVIICVVLYWFIIEKTTYGFSLRATGFNKEGARFSGMKVERNIVSSMMISGAFAGAAGAVITLGTFGYGRVLGAMENVGFDGIAVALVGAGNAVGILLSGLLFGLLKAAQTTLQFNNIPKEISELISASIILFIALKYGIELLLQKKIFKFPTKKKIDNEKGGNK